MPVYYTLMRLFLFFSVRFGTCDLFSFFFLISTFLNFMLGILITFSLFGEACQLLEMQNISKFHPPFQTLYSE